MHFIKEKLCLCIVRVGDMRVKTHASLTTALKWVDELYSGIKTRVGSRHVGALGYRL
jgi:hypothetical protein